MAKIVSQISFTDYGVIEVLGDLERFALALSGINDEALMLKLEAQRGNGRNEYPIRVMWNLLIAMKDFGHRTIESFRRELARNSQLRSVCGLNDLGHKKHLVPPARVFSGFLQKLVAHQMEIEAMFDSMVLQLSEKLPEFGKDTAGDGKYLDSYAKRADKNPNDNAGKRAEHDAKWGVKEYHYEDRNGKSQIKKESHFGFKAHIVCDVKTELPMAYEVSTANSDEKKAMIRIIEKMPSKITSRMEHLMLDKGYDSTEMIRAAKAMEIIPIADIRNCRKDGETTKQYKDTSIAYDFKGNVYMVDNEGELRRMRYKGYDCQKKCLRYAYAGKVYKIYVSYDERVFLPVARDSKKFERLYKGRTSVERLNGRLDRDYMLEDHCIRGLEKMKLMVSLTLLTMNAMALGKIKGGDTTHLAALTKFEKLRAA